jgi:hypothetical protein
MRHLHENFHKKFKNPDLGILLWQAACATTEDVYLDTIKKMRDINEKAVDWLLKEAEPQFWIECYFEGNCYGHLTSNIAESFNSTILTAHEQPILAMLETIRQQLTDWFTARRLLEAKTPGGLISTVLNQLNELTKRAWRSRRARESIPGELFEITSNETGRKYLVNLNLHTCSCRAWQSMGIPLQSHTFSHPQSSIVRSRLYESFFTLNTFRKTYNNAIIPPSISDLGAMTAGPLPPPQPVNDADKSSDDDEDDSEEDEDDSKDKSILPPLFGVSQADQERREQKLKRKGGGLGGVPSGGLRSADCAVQSDISISSSHFSGFIQRGPARGLLFSMSSWHKEEEYICFNDLFSFLMKDFKFVTWWLVLKFKTGAWLFLQIRVFSWLFLKFTLNSIAPLQMEDRRILCRSCILVVVAPISFLWVSKQILWGNWDIAAQQRSQETGCRPQKRK